MKRCEIICKSENTLNCKFKFDLIVVSQHASLKEYTGIFRIIINRDLFTVSSLFLKVQYIYKNTDKMWDDVLIY